MVRLSVFDGKLSQSWYISRTEVLSLLQPETKQVWLELCAEAAVSEDPARLRQLETQIVEVLRAEQQRQEAQTLPRPKTVQDTLREQGAA